MSELSRVEAITFDFFNTLIFHRDGRGRGQLLMEYLQVHGLRPLPWEHRILYDVFESHDTEYSPEAPRTKGMSTMLYSHSVYSRDWRYRRLTRTCLDMPSRCGRSWVPPCFDVFPDALEALQTLKAEGYPLAVISNWQCGLRHFCAELGLSEYFDHVLGSADLGVAKPDGRIFADACSRLGAPAARVLHVGDTLADDYLGGEAAGLLVVLVDRDPEPESRAARVIQGLDELPRMLTPSIGSR